MPIAKYNGSFGRLELVHLLKRTTFGAHLKDLDAFKGKSLTEVLTILTLDRLIPTPPINTYNDASYSDPSVSLNQTWVIANYDDGITNSKRLNSLRGWLAGTIINQRGSIQEKMMLFWHNHFALESGNVDDARYMYKYFALLQKYAVGNFKTLVKEITLDPAMLKYLNGYLSSKTAPDENYGRELQELFTMGKGVNSKYTESDVKAAAKVLTGYRIDSIKIESYFDATKHDNSDKQFSSFYNNLIIKGKTAATGANELDDLLNMLFLQNEVAMFICRKLYRFFVYYDITSQIEQEVIAPLAQTFIKSNFEIKPVLVELLGSDHFFKSENRSCFIKTPLDLVIGLCREFDVVFPDANDAATQYVLWLYMKGQAGILQLGLGDPPNVSGWPAFYQFPQFYEIWINSDTLPKRNQFTDIMISAGVTRNSKKVIIDPLKYAASFSKPEDPNILVSEVSEHLLTLPSSVELKQQLKNILLSNQTNDYYWTDAWIAYQLSPTDNIKRGVVLGRLQIMIKYMMNLPEFQLI
jgi:uncharacterized protein (DUF1800 family)